MHWLIIYFFVNYEQSYMCIFNFIFNSQLITMFMFLQPAPGWVNVGSVCFPFSFFFLGFDEWHWTQATVLEIYSSHLQKCWLWSAVFVDPLMESVIWAMSCITLRKLHFTYFVCVLSINTSTISEALKTHLPVFTYIFLRACFALSHPCPSLLLNIWSVSNRPHLSRLSVVEVSLQWPVFLTWRETQWL